MIVETAAEAAPEVVVHEARPPLLQQAARILNEPVMGFLALVALGTALGPLVFPLSAAVERGFDVLEGGIVLLFAVEFYVQYRPADDRRAWLRSAWRIIDVVTIAGPVLALLPQVSDALGIALALRLLRVGRAVVFGTRAGAVAVRKRAATGHTLRRTPPKLSLVRPEGGLQPEAADWGTFLAWTRQPAPAWYHAASVDGSQFRDVAGAAGLGESDLARVSDPKAHARCQRLERDTLLLLPVPTVSEGGFPEVRRHRLPVLANAEGVVTALDGSLDLQASVGKLTGRIAVPELAFPARICCAILALARERHAYVADRLEAEIRELEAVPVTEGGPAFLKHTFRLSRELAAAAVDLWGTKGVIRALGDGKTTLPGADLRDEKFLDDLLAETDALHGRVSQLHINVTSFEMNKFMKLLAIVSFLGLIPSVAGGMLGMNVEGNPWPLTLGEVALGVAMGMATSPYWFAMKGWLR